MNIAIKQESYRIETIMGGMRKECFNLCCEDLRTNELSVDEVNCVDRCSWRYLSTYAALSRALDRTGKNDIAKKI